MSKPGHRHAHDALHADQRETARELAPIASAGIEPVAFDRSPRRRRAGARSPAAAAREIAEQVGAAGDPFFGLTSISSSGTAAECAAAGAER